MKNANSIPGNPHPLFDNGQLGFVAAGKRTIKDGSQYDHLFPKCKGGEEILNPSGTVYDTVGKMEEIARQHTGDTMLLAEKLRRKTKLETCRAIFDFAYNHIQYELDKPGVEELRRPARTWQDRNEGIDCDCFSILISSILLNLSIPHKFRVTKYEAGWQHVYIIVPDQSSQRGYWVIDCVLDSFDYEKPFTDKFDHAMKTSGLNGIPIVLLNGAPGESAASDLLDIITGRDLQPVSGFASPQDELDAIYNYLVRTRDFIQANPSSVLNAGGAAAHLEMFNTAIKYWNTPHRASALAHLAEQEDLWNKRSGLKGNDESVNGFGQLGGLKQFFQNVKDTVQKVVEGAKDVIKDVGQNIVKYNPVSLAMRGGFLLALRLNLFGMAYQLGPAVGVTPGRISATQITVAKNRYERIRKLFVDKLKGKEEKLKEAIQKGAAHKGLMGFGCAEPIGTLGDPVTITAVVAAAVPILEAFNALNDGQQKLGATEAETTADENELTQPSSSTYAAAAQGLAAFVTKVKEWFARRQAKKLDANDTKATDEANKAAAETTEAPLPTTSNTNTPSTPAPTTAPPPGYKVGDQRPGANAHVGPGGRPGSNAPVPAYQPATPSLPTVDIDAYKYGDSSSENPSPPPIPPRPGRNVPSLLDRGKAWVAENPGTAVALFGLTVFGITMCFPKPRHALFGKPKLNELPVRTNNPTVPALQGTKAKPGRKTKLVHAKKARILT